MSCAINKYRRRLCTLDTDTTISSEASDLSLPRCSLKSARASRFQRSRTTLHPRPTALLPPAAGSYRRAICILQVPADFNAAAIAVRSSVIVSVSNFRKCAASASAGHLVCYSRSIPTLPGRLRAWKTRRHRCENEADPQSGACVSVHVSMIGITDSL